jgi:hypothetical protein
LILPIDHSGVDESTRLEGTLRSGTGRVTVSISLFLHRESTLFVENVGSNAGNDIGNARVLDRQTGYIYISW